MIELARMPKDEYFGDVKVGDTVRLLYIGYAGDLTVVKECQTVYGYPRIVCANGTSWNVERTSPDCCVENIMEVV